uniref:Uncharacterized protein n=1 Tax=Candidatus Kentrum eta TaxID=2126337 RepID=A0A450U7S5_9GAMM|nr:MAG: hypothetical protein BECKH772A_GA0070896_100063 [Candidatus Kentron sp. H]VFJ89907.1 MAG: hypothetical protein BECKH772B_GA0070898_100073 [Candidatus Kentron sp. H]VFJ96300.1 MAG: hypothetical protein BECKH772C_GA0070978_100063 [Candidatus Kentron sp. H]
MLALRAKSGRGWVPVHAPVPQSILFFRYLSIKAFATSRTRALLVGKAVAMFLPVTTEEWPHFAKRDYSTF